MKKAAIVLHLRALTPSYTLCGLVISKTVQTWDDCDVTDEKWRYCRLCDSTKRQAFSTLVASVVVPLKRDAS